MPTLILSDLKMPQMNGYELLAWVKTQPKLKRIPFIILSASNVPVDFETANDLGANSYLVKPAGSVQLVEI
ncbi:MAG: response regulator [Verrucomicrobia bacterium]|nr:response regulator [Verrucomicrobiota bacterium]